MFLAAVNCEKDKVDIRVKLLSVKSAPMEAMVVLPKLTKLPAFWQITLPSTVSGPSRLTTPSAFGPTTMLPETPSVQAARGAASAPELIVIVGCAQNVGVDAAGRI